jgi:hypothetical protein
MLTRPVALNHRFALALAVLLQGILSGCSADQSPPVTGGAATTLPAAGRPQAALEVAWRGGADAVTVVLRNTGQTPIKVDRKLVLLVAINALDANGAPIHWDRGPAMDRPKNVQDRFVTLAPGEAAERIVDLRTGFPNFVWGWGTRVSAQGSYHVPNAYVALDRLPASARPAAIEVRYETGGFMYDDCFRAYTGQRLADSGLYQGPLARRIPWPRTRQGQQK